MPELGFLKMELNEIYFKNLSIARINVFVNLKTSAGRFLY